MQEDPIDTPSQQPAKEPSQQPAQETSQQPVQEPIQQPAQETRHQPVQEPIQQPIQEPNQQSAKELSQQAAQEPSQQAAQETSQQPVQEPNQQPIQEPSQQPVQEPSQQPAKELSQQPAQEPQQNGFLSLPLSPPIMAAVEAIGYETPSPIQAQAIPLLAAGKDLMGIAQTGTGKTAAFALPLLGMIDLEHREPQILCLTPTRELAIQVAEAMETFAQKLRGLQILPVYGGTEFGGQLRALKKGVHVVVGTPGRVMDHVRRGTLDLAGLKAFVLDEADEMLSMGFIEDVEWLLEHTPPTRQTALFSATMPKPIAKLCDKYLNEPAKIRIKVKAESKQNIRQRFMKLRQGEKTDALFSLLDVENYDGILVFARTKAATSELAEMLLAKGYNAEALNGDMPQHLREKTVERLKSKKLDILVATDVAARGLDVERISHVVNFDAPFDVEAYVHRIGRTGRAGREGDAILFVCGKEARILNAIQKTLKFECTPYEFPTVEELNQRKEQELFEQIDKTLEAGTEEYKTVLGKYLESHPEVEPMDLAAAMAYLESGGKPFQIKSAPNFSSGKNKGYEREERFSNRDKKFKERDRDRGYDDNSDFDTYRVDVGMGDNVQKGDLVGALANEAGLHPKNIGRIKLFQDFGLVDLPKGMPKEIYQTLQKLLVRGKPLRIRKDQGRPAGRKKVSTRPFEKPGGKRKFSHKGKGKTHNNVHWEN